MSDGRRKLRILPNELEKRLRTLYNIDLHATDPAPRNVYYKLTNEHGCNRCLSVEVKVNAWEETRNYLMLNHDG